MFEEINMTEQIYALTRFDGIRHHYFYVGRTNDPKRRLAEHHRNVRNPKHNEDVYVYIRECMEPCGIPIWSMEVLENEHGDPVDECEDFWVVLMIRAGYDLKNMKHGDLKKIAKLRQLAEAQGDFTTVKEFVEFREAYERSQRLKQQVLDQHQGDPQLTEMIRQNAERFRSQNEAAAKRRLRKEARQQAKAIEKEEWLKSLRKGNDNG
jgi:hypothetical protein